jgi:hypothetical protein
MSKLGVELNITAGGIDNIDKVAEKVSSANTSLKQMKQELRNVTNELLATEPGSEKFVQLTQQAGKLKDQMKDVAESINANAGPAVESLGNNFSLLTGKLANLDFAGAGESIKAIGGNISNIKFGDFVKGVQSMGAALASVGKALLTNPIFLVAATIIAIGVALKDALDDAKEATFAMANATLAANDASKEAAKSFDLEERKLRALGVAEDEIAEKRNAANKSRLEAARAATRAQLSVVTELQKQVEKSQGLIDAGFRGSASLIYATQEELNEAQEKYRQLTSELAELEVKELERVAAARQKRSDDQKRIEEERLSKSKEIKTETIKNEIEIQQTEEENLDKRIEQEQKTQDAIREAREQRLNDEEALAEEIFQLGLSEQERELQAVRDTFFEKIALAEQFGLDATALREEQAKREVEIAKKYAEEEVEVVKITNAQKLANAAGTAQQLLGVASSLSEAFGKDGKKQFELNKKFSIAQALISTFLGVNAALTAGGNPAKLATGAQFVEAGVVLATGLANVAKIARTKFEGGGSSGGGGGSLSAAGAAGGGSTPSSGFGAFNASLINNRPPQMTPAYVLAGDVKSQGEARQKVEDRARL